MPDKWGVCQVSHDLWLQQASEILCHTFQILFVEKFKKLDRKSLRFLAVKVLYLTIYEIWKVWKKFLEDCHDQSFLVSLYIKLEKSDKKIFKFVAIKSFGFDWMQIQKASFENLWGITTSLPLKCGAEKQKHHLPKRRQRPGTNSVYSI